MRLDYKGQMRKVSDYMHTMKKLYTCNTCGTSITGVAAYAIIQIGRQVVIL